MNNTKVAEMPDAPANVADWHIFDELYNCTVDFGRSNATKKSFQYQRRVLMLDLLLMSKTVCVACSGYGHVKKDCPTNGRLSVLGSVSDEAGHLLAWGRNKALAEVIEVQAQDAGPDQYHRVPKVLPNKRVRVPVNRNS